MIELVNEYLETGMIVEGIKNNKILVEDEQNVSFYNF